MTESPLLGSYRDRTRRWTSGRGTGAGEGGAGSAAHRETRVVVGLVTSQEPLQTGAERLTSCLVKQLKLVKRRNLTSRQLTILGLPPDQLFLFLVQI